MSRYRLRFHLQEVDLQRGITYIGRSEECEVTIEDPLVSRRHARIVFEGDDVTLEDLGSRNGVKVNGKQVKGSQKLVDADRVRIGTQDFVFCRVQPKADRQSKTTGVLRLCGQCKAPYAREVVSCPNCGAVEPADEETLSGAFGASSQYSWSVQLLVEALDKALGLARIPDAERILRRATALLEERISAGGQVQMKQLAPLADAADRVSRETSDPSWGAWIAAFCVRASLFPSAQVTDRLIAMRGRHPELLEPIESLIDHCRALDAPEIREDRDAFQRLVRAQERSDDELAAHHAGTAAPPKPN